MVVKLIIHFSKLFYILRQLNEYRHLLILLEDQSNLNLFALTETFQHTIKVFNVFIFKFHDI